MDDYLIESVTHTKRVMNPAEKVDPNPVRGDRPWEGKEVRVSFVMFDDHDQTFKMWYTSPTFKAHPEGTKIVYQELSGVTCLATSRDGIHWEKPALGLTSYRGSTQNNIIPETNLKPYMILDLHDKNPAKLYKGLVRTGTMTTPGMRFDLYFSPDGFHWTPYEKKPVIDTAPRVGRWGPTTFTGWDPIRQTYAVYMENCFHHGCPIGKRSIGRAESPDMIHWSEPETILIPDERDFPDTEFYSMPVFPYEGMQVGLLWNFRTTNTSILPQVVFSRDGIAFDREYRLPFIPPGPNGAFDSTVIYVESVIPRGNRTFLYYTGANWRADESLLVLGDKAMGAIGLAIVPSDGFVSLDGAKTFSEMVTRSFTFSGSRLQLNVRTALEGNGGAGDGDVRVEICGPDNIPLPGFRFKDANPITASGEAQVVSWNSNALVSQLNGKPIKLHFYFKNAKLFSFQFQ